MRKARARIAPEILFFRKVTKTESCWSWVGSKNHDGYGNLRYQGRNVKAHRLAYEWFRGPIPDGFHVDHICHNRACVNPDHLRIVTQAQNKQNRNGAPVHSKSGVRGVSWHEGTHKWKVQVQIDLQKHHLGYFLTIEEATATASEWRRIHMPYSEMDKKKEVA